MSLLDELEGDIDIGERIQQASTSLLDELEGDVGVGERELEGVDRTPLVWQNTDSEAMQLIGEENRKRVIKAQAIATVTGLSLEDAYNMQPYIEREREEPGYAKTIALQTAATFGGVIPKAVGNLFKVGGAVYDEWDSAVGKALDYTGLPAEYRGIVDESLGRTIGRTGDRLYEIGHNAEEYWQPQVSGAKKYVAQAIDTLATMVIGASTGYTLPVLAGISGLEKAAGTLREGYTLPRALAAGGVSSMLEYTSEFNPILILGKPGLSFVKRLTQGLLYDVPGELAATLGDMKLVDEMMLGKSYPIGTYAQALLDTLIVSSLVTGIGTSVSHVAVEDVSVDKNTLDTAMDNIKGEERQKRIVPTEEDIEKKPVRLKLSEEEAVEEPLPDVVSQEDIETFLESIASGGEDVTDVRDRLKGQILKAMPELGDEQAETTIALTIDAPARALGMTPDEFISMKIAGVQADIGAGGLFQSPLGKEGMERKIDAALVANVPDLSIPKAALIAYGKARFVTVKPSSPKESAFYQLRKWLIDNQRGYDINAAETTLTDEEYLARAKRRGEKLYQGEPPMVNRDIVLDAYEGLKQQKGFSNVEISNIQKATNIPMDKLKEFIKREARAGRAVLSRGDWSLADESERAGGIAFEEGETPYLLVKFLDKISREEPPSTARSIFSEIKAKVASKIEIGQALYDHFDKEEITGKKGLMRTKAPGMFVKAGKGGTTFDKVAQGMKMTTDELAAEMRAAKTLKEQRAAEKTALKEHEEGAGKAAAMAVYAEEERPNVTVESLDLRPGDTFAIYGEQYTVEDIDAIGNVLLNVGGTAMTVEPSSELPGPDEQSMVRAERETPIAARGSIEFTENGKAIISLLKTADASSFPHEMFHLYVYMIATIPELGEQLKVLEGWVGKPYAEWTVGDKEMAARSGERYLWEGIAPTEGLKAVFDKFRQWLREIYISAQDLNVELSPDVKKLWGEWFGGKMGGKMPIANIPKPARTKGQGRTTKQQVRVATGQVKPINLVREDKALEAGFKKAAMAARVAFRAGNLSGVEKEKVKLRNILNRAKKIRAVRDIFQLTDADMKKISRRNPLLMSQYEFYLYINEVRQKAFEYTENKHAKLAVLDLIRTKELRKVENLQRAMALPPIQKMTTEQANEFFSILEKYEAGDVFISQRMLETVARTDLGDIKTWREALGAMAKEAGIPIEELGKLDVSGWDKFKYDTQLMRKNPLLRLLVMDVSRVLGSADIRAHDVERQAVKLAKAAEKSRNRMVSEKIVNAFIPQDKDLIKYMESPEDQKPAMASVLTKEQLDYAHFIENYWQNALKYLMETQALKQGREKYFVHIRQGVLEYIKEEGLFEIIKEKGRLVKEEGLLSAAKSFFTAYEQQLEVFNISAGRTGEILPFEKFFPFALPRTGEVAPTYNVTQAFMTYVRLFEKKVALDSIIPKFAIYAQAATPQKLTPRGLEMDRRVKEFVYEYINNKKGRRIDQFLGEQGGAVDMGMRGLRTLITALDLGFSIPVGMPAFIGEQVANFVQHGAGIMAKGSKRAFTKKGHAIVDKYTSFIGRSTWEELASPEKGMTGKFHDLMFSMLHESSRTANIQSLLGSMTDAEFESETLSDARLSEIRLEAGRMRVITGMKSLKGSTSLGSLLMQYKTWATPPLLTGLSDMSTFISDLKSKPLAGALTTKEVRELYRIAGAIIPVAITGAVLIGADDDDDTFLGVLKRKAYREALLFLGAINPALWTPVRAVSFLVELSNNIYELATLETYKTKEGLKGWEGLKKQFTFNAVKPFLTED